MQAIVIDADWDPRPGAALSQAERDGRWARDARLAWRHPRWATAVLPDPVITRPDEVIVRVRAVGAAVSNLRMIATDRDGYVQLPYRMRVPLVPGHEIAGEIVAAGPAVQDLGPGDAVALETLRPCGRCAACLRSLPNQCGDVEFSGFSVNGGMSEYVVAPAAHARTLAGLARRFGAQDVFEIGALCEPASVAYVGMFLQAGGFAPGSAVAVFGCGPVGLAAVALARCAGAATVIAFDKVPRRCEVALAVGADAALGVEQTALDPASASTAIAELTEGNGVAMAVDATGAAASVVPRIEASLAVGGKVVHLGVGGPQAYLRTMTYMSLAASAHYMMGHLGGFEPVIALHAAGRLDLRPLISARFGLADGIEALAHAAVEPGPKTLILPHGSA